MSWGPWEKTPAGAWTADIHRSRLLVKRTGRRHRTWMGKIDGSIVGIWDTVEMAMSQTAKKAREQKERGGG